VTGRDSSSAVIKHAEALRHVLTGRGLDHLTNEVIALSKEVDSALVRRYQ
jgi:hypothetical protein